MERPGREQALAVLRSHGMDGLIVIGGDGSIRGAQKLHEEFDYPVYAVPGSIDNDIAGTDFSIGFDTAVNTAVEAIDRVRDTAISHDRIFVIEVMGRRNGLIALEAALSGGAEAVLMPEFPSSMEALCKKLIEAAEMGKRSSIIIVAEGAGKAEKIRKGIQECLGVEVRAVVLGHMQRGGRPTSFDRVLALRLASLATTRLIGGHRGEMAGIEANDLVTPTFKQVLSSTRVIDPQKLQLVEMMAR
jgi:6-phosphofructokinase 1